MNKPISSAAGVSSLRQRLIDDMNMRRFSPETQRNYIRDVRRFATFLGRAPDTATAEDLRRFQVEQREAGVPVPTMNSIVSALRCAAMSGMVSLVSGLKVCRCPSTNVGSVGNCPFRLYLIEVEAHGA